MPRPRDRIVVFGSFHTVGPALDWLEALIAAAAALPEYTAPPRASLETKGRLLK